MSPVTVLVVTGAASGMGRATVERLRGTVDQLLAVDLDAPDIDGADGLACDVSDPSAVARRGRRGPNARHVPRARPRCGHLADDG